MAEVTFAVDGKTLTATTGALLINACKAPGIEMSTSYHDPRLVTEALVPEL